MDYKEKLKAIINSAKTPYVDINTLLKYFPELKKSRDERIADEIIQFLYLPHPQFVGKRDHEEWIKWLKKQGERDVNEESFIEGYKLGYREASKNIVEEPEKYGLQKQGLQKSNPYSGTSFDYNGHTWGMCARDNGVEILVDGKIKERVFLGNKPLGKSALETINEEKVDNTNKVEPKFKVGDIIRHKKQGFTCKIIAVDTEYRLSECQGTHLPFEAEDAYEIVEPKFKVEKDKWYVCISQFCNCIEGRVYKATSDSRIIDDFGTEYDIHSDAYKYFRLWTIEDAKDGDVLVVNNVIFIYKKTIANHIVSYCKLINNVFEPNRDARTCCEGNAYIYPATKEQRNLLFQKMKEAGYEWDAEKKELKKVEQKSAWNEEDEKMIEAALQFAHEYGRHGLWCWLKSLKERVQPQNGYNPYKEVVESIAEMCKHYDKASHSGLRDFYDNVKVKCKDAKEYDSLFPQTIWKPSDEQMEALETYLYNPQYISNSEDKRLKLVESLYEQLKKLKGEL